MKRHDKIIIAYCVNTIIRFLILIAHGVYANKEAPGIVEAISAYDDLDDALTKWIYR